MIAFGVVSILVVALIYGLSRLNPRRRGGGLASDDGAFSWFDAGSGDGGHGGHGGDCGGHGH